MYERKTRDVLNLMQVREQAVAPLQEPYEPDGSLLFRSFDPISRLQTDFRRLKTQK
jgi:hypothetical protein